MLGLGYRLHQGRITQHEYLRIEPGDSQSTLTYVALPSGQSETRFQLASVSEGQLVFINPQHDFPQQISYRYISENRLQARVEAGAKGFDLHFVRTACDLLLAPAAGPQQETP